MRAISSIGLGDTSVPGLPCGVASGIPAAGASTGNLAVATRRVEQDPAAIPALPGCGQGVRR